MLAGKPMVEQGESAQHCPHSIACSPPGTGSLSSAHAGIEEEEEEEYFPRNTSLLLPGPVRWRKR